MDFNPFAANSTSLGCLHRTALTRPLVDGSPQCFYSLQVLEFSFLRPDDLSGLAQSNAKAMRVDATISVRKLAMVGS